MDPWNLEIRCKYGKVYPHGGKFLQAYTDRRIKRGELRDIPGVKLHQWGDTECTVIFPVEVLPAVLDVLKPRVKRTVDPERMKHLRSLSPLAKGKQ